MAFNKLTPAQAERLALLAEECGEVVRAIGKVLRHGYQSSSPLINQSESNQEALEEECGDVMAAILILTASGDIEKTSVTDHCDAKLEAVWQWMHHAKSKSK